MFKYLYNKLFASQTVKQYPVVEEQPEEKELDIYELDISEPVYSFLETLKNNPKRFKIQCIQNRRINRIYPDFKYTLLDTFTGCKFSCDFSFYGEDWGYSRDESTSFLTTDEIRLIGKTIDEFYRQRNAERRSKINQWKRNKLMKVYCK